MSDESIKASVGSARKELVGEVFEVLGYESDVLGYESDMLCSKLRSKECE
jgi:hypothetical protein